MDFDSNDETVPSRREFLGTVRNALQLAAVGCVFAPLASGCGQAVIATRSISDNRIEANVALLVNDGMSAVLDRKGPDGKGILIVRESPTSYIAMSMRCTHKGCEVAPPNDEKIIICGCHDSRFDLNGAVIKAPATQPLVRYTTKYDNDSRSIAIDLV